MSNFIKVKILNGYVNSISLKALCEEISKWVKEQKGHYICVAPVHSCIEAYDNEEFAKAYNGSDITVPDGRPVFWALKLLGYKDSEHLRGEYITRNVCKYAAENNFEVGFYGGNKNSLEECINVLKNQYKSLKVNFSFSPPGVFKDLLKKKTIN